MSKDLPVSSHATSATEKLLVQASLTSDARSQPIQRGTSGTATIQDEAVERLNSEVAEYQTRVWDALATFDWTDKAAGQWHPAESVMVNHAPVKCKVLYDDDKKTDVTEFALTITPLYYVP